MKNLIKKILQSESKFDDIISLSLSLIQFSNYRGNFIKSRFVYFKNEGSLTIQNGKFFFGFLTNRMGLDPNAKGVFRIYKSGNVTINGGVRIARDCKVYVAGNLRIGKGTYINPNTMIFSRTEVTIGENCAIAWNCQILDDDFHTLSSNSVTAKPIVIGNNVWIGANVIILKGVTIGDGVVVAAGSLITKDVKKNCLVGGNPSKILKNDISWS